jgi:hypothetical protein
VEPALPIKVMLGKDALYVAVPVKVMAVPFTVAVNEGPVVTTGGGVAAGVVVVFLQEDTDKAIKAITAIFTNDCFMGLV